MLKIDNDKCLRCGMCTGIAPDIFEFSDEGDIKVNEEIITEENAEDIETAISSCPVQAISEKEDEEKEDN